MDDLKSKETELIEVGKMALVVIDLQNGIVQREHAPHGIDQVVRNAARLMQVFKENGEFVVRVRVSSLDGKDVLHPKTDFKTGHPQLFEGWDSFVPEVEKIENVHTITKRQWGAFYGTDLDLQLRRRGIETIVLCGISTGIGVDTTAREAYQRGYHQIFVEDAMTASTKEEHDYVCRSIFPRIGQLRTCEDILNNFALSREENRDKFETRRR